MDYLTSHLQQRCWKMQQQTIVGSSPSRPTAAVCVPSSCRYWKRRQLPQLLLRSHLHVADQCSEKSVLPGKSTSC
jgi:hypothetical protein